jgi:plastocyanin
MRRIARLLAFSIPLVLLVVPLGTVPAVAHESDPLEIQGSGTLLFGPVDPTFKINRLVQIPWSMVGGVPQGVPANSTGFQETYGYHDFVTRVQSGDVLQVVNKSDDVHTFTVVNKSDQPKSLDAAFGCFAAGPCSKAPPDTPTIGHVGDGAFVGFQGFTRQVVAPAGSVLYFMCIFHPEMQGKIIVTGDD